MLSQVLSKPSNKVVLHRHEETEERTQCSLLYLQDCTSPPDSIQSQHRAVRFDVLLGVVNLRQ